MVSFRHAPTPQPMRALIVSHAAIRASNRRGYRALASRGVDVTVLVPDTWKSGLGMLKAEPEPLDSPLHVAVCRRLGLSHSNGYALANFDGVVRSVRPDAMYVDEDPAAFTAAQAAWSAKRHRAGLVVLAIQNLLKRYPQPFVALQRYVFRESCNAVSVSEQAAQTLRRRGFTGAIDPMPFSTDLTAPPQDERARTRAAFDLIGTVAGFVGRLVPEKGIDVFLRALAELPQVRGAIVGDGPEGEALRALAGELRIADRVHFLGARAPGVAAQILSALDVLVLPSRTRPNWAEQFGRVLIEAMASGVPVVASDSGAISEVVGDAGVLVPEDDAHALAAGIDRALADTSLRARGIQRVDAHFRIANEVDGLERALARASDRWKSSACA